MPSQLFGNAWAMSNQFLDTAFLMARQLPVNVKQLPIQCLFNLYSIEKMAVQLLVKFESIVSQLRVTG